MMVISMQRCFCGWNGLEGIVIAGRHCCPVCSKPFTQMRCEGCGE
mgnify:CR=1 FL=1